MSTSVIRLSVPPEPTFARSVRMMAANLAVLCSMSVDDVEDARMAAEEAFIYSCATRPEQCEVTFSLADDALNMVFSLGNAQPTEDEALAEQVALAELLLSAVSDEYVINTSEAVLSVSKSVGGVYAD